LQEDQIDDEELKRRKKRKQNQQGAAKRKFFESIPKDITLADLCFSLQ